MKKLFSLALAAAMALSMLTGCGGNSSNANDANGSDAQGSQAGQTEQLSGVVNTNGSTSMEKVMQVLIEAFQEQRPNVTVNYTGSGSGAGVTSAIDGTADLGLASRALKSEEEGKGAQAHIVALDGVAIVVNPENTSSSLLMATMTSEVFMPARCCRAPEIPQAMYSLGPTVLPVWPTWCPRYSC